MRISAWFNVLQRLAIAASLSLACLSAHADPVSYSGSVSDPDNPALMGSGAEPSKPMFGSPEDIANNVAVYGLMVPFGGFTDFNFGGFSDIDSLLFRLFNAEAPSVGIRPLLTLFRGNDASAVFVTSTFPDPTSVSSNADLRIFLTAGDYMFTIGNQTNRAVADLRGQGTLGQGFSGRGDPEFTGDGTYRLLVTTPVPEPETLWLAAIGAGALLLRRRRRQAPVRSGRAET